MRNSALTIRPMNVSDINTVAIIHFESFPTSRSSRLGMPFLRRLYQWYALYYPQLSMVATLDGKVIGFVTGVIRSGELVPRRFSYTFWQIVWGFLRHPHLFFQPEMYEAWRVHLRGSLLRRVSQAPRVEQTIISKVLKATLDSIAVAPHARGKNVGQALVRTFEEAAEQQGATLVALGVESNNSSARHLYELCGWQLVCDNIDNNAASYVKYLQTG